LYLDAWFDWNGNGNWYDQKVITESYNPSKWKSTSKTVTINITPPKNQPKDMWVRFRLGYGEGNLKRTFGFEGVSLFGEVEDYNVSVKAKDYDPKSEFVCIKNTSKNLVQTAKIGQSLQFIGFNSPPKIYRRSNSGKIERADSVTQIGKKYFLFNVKNARSYGVNCRKSGGKRDDSVIGYKDPVEIDAVFMISKVDTNKEIFASPCGEDEVFGDANEDGKIDDADLYYIWQVLWGGQPATMLSDANLDGAIDEDDMFYVAQIIETERLPYPLTLEVSTKSEFAAEGTLAEPFKGNGLVILNVPPKGDFWIDQRLLEKISEKDGICGFAKRFFSLSEDKVVGYYDIYALHPGIDGVWGTSVEEDLETVLRAHFDRPILATDSIQDEVNEILESLINDPYSDDLMALLNIRLEEPYVELDPIEDVLIGEPLVVSGITNREEGCTIVLTCRGAKAELCPATTQVENGMFEAVFDTIDAVPGEYTVKTWFVDDVLTDEVTVNIWG
jgi:hypothetical protein